MIRARRAILSSIILVCCAGLAAALAQDALGQTGPARRSPAPARAPRPAQTPGMTDQPAPAGGQPAWTAPGTSGTADTGTMTAPPAAPPAVAPPLPKYPRSMQVAGTAVNVRSGPGLYYYEVAKLNEPTRVVGLSEESGWVAVKPPASVVALVKKEDVQRDERGNSSVRAASARVYARDQASGRTWAVIDQLPVDTGVKIVREEGPHYVITMPATARVFISLEFLKEAPGRGAGAILPELPKVEPLELDPQGEAFEKAATALDAELEKPLALRNFDALERDLTEVQAKAKAGYLKDSAAEVLETIKLQRDLQQGLKRLASDKQALERDLAALKKKSEEQQAALAKGPPQAPPAADFEGTLYRLKAQVAYPYALEDAPGHYVCLLRGNAALLEPLVGKNVRVWGDKQYRADWDKHVCDVKRVEAVP